MIPAPLLDKVLLSWILTRDKLYLRIIELNGQPWVLVLFEGVGSWAPVCVAMGVACVAVCNNRPTGPGTGPGANGLVFTINMDLHKSFKVKNCVRAAEPCLASKPPRCWGWRHTTPATPLASVQRSTCSETLMAPQSTMNTTLMAPRPTTLGGPWQPTMTKGLLTQGTSSSLAWPAGQQAWPPHCQGPPTL